MGLTPHADWDSGGGLSNKAIGHDMVGDSESTEYRRMTTFLVILAPTFGIVGVVLGVLLNEFLRRKNRREVYAPMIFEKRLAFYERLAEHINKGSEIADEVIENLDLTAEQRHDQITMPVKAIANYVGKHWLYIDQELGAHCTALFMGVEDIQTADGQEREELLKNYRNMRMEALRMIAEDSGVAEINKFFRAINRPKFDGPFIERLRELRRQRE